MGDFFNFINELNKNNVNYYFLRGFDKLPDKPNTDIDLVFDYKQYDLYHKIAKKHLSLELGNNNHHDFGFAEYRNASKLLHTLKDIKIGEELTCKYTLWDIKKVSELDKQDWLGL